MLVLTVALVQQRFGLPLLEFEVVAEGIETLEQLQFLTTHQCSIGQGYLFSKAVPIEALEVEIEKGGIFNKGTL